MENQNLRLILIFTIFGVLGLLGFCIGTTLLWALLNLSSAPTPTLTLTASQPPGIVSTWTPTPAWANTSTSTFTPSATDSITVTVATTPTPPITPSATETEPLEEPEATSSPTITPSPTIGVALSDAWCVPWNTKKLRATVIRVLDGVSFQASANGEILRVNYIGIDVPEPFNGVDTQTAAFNQNKRLLEGKSVILIQDKSETIGEGGPLPRYVIVGGTFANLELVESGYAVARSAPPDIVCDRLFQGAEELARAAGRGVWAPTPTPTRTRPAPTATLARTGNVIISYIFYRGEKWQEPNEFIEIHNLGDGPVQLKNWTIKDLENHVYVFPEYIMQPDQYCRVYTNEYHSGTCGFSFNNPAPIWDDLKDCAYLKDSLGVLVDEYCYE